MAKEYLWNIRVNGIRHEILARHQGNSFDIYVDEEFRFNIPVNPNLDIEEDLTVGGKRCRVVVYGGVPDLAVDGILMNAEAKLIKQEKRSRVMTVIAGIALVLLGIFAMWMYLAVTLSGEELYFGIFGPIFALLVSAAGVVLTVYGIRKKGI